MRVGCYIEDDADDHISIEIMPWYRDLTPNKLKHVTRILVSFDVSLLQRNDSRQHQDHLEQKGQ